MESIKSDASGGDLAVGALAAGAKKLVRKSNPKRWESQSFITVGYFGNNTLQIVRY